VAVDIAELGIKVTTQGVSEATSSMEGLSATATRLMDTIKSLLAVAGVGLGFGELVRSIEDSQSAFAQLNAVVTSTHAATGYMTSELVRMAQAFQQVTSFSAPTIERAETILLQYGKIGREVFPQVVQAAMNLAARMGGDLPAAAMALGRIAENPLRALQALRVAHIALTETQVEAVKRFAVLGEGGKALQVVLAAVAQQAGGAAAAEFATLGGKLAALRNSFNDLLTLIGEGGFSAAVTQIVVRLRDWIAANGDTARSLGALAGGALLTIADLIGKAATHTTLLKVAFEGLLGIKVAEWIYGIGVALVGITFTPGGLVLAGIGLVAAAVLLIATNWQKVKDAFDTYWNDSSGKTTDIAKACAGMAVEGLRAPPVAPRPPPRRMPSWSSGVGTAIGEGYSALFGGQKPPAPSPYWTTDESVRQLEESMSPAIPVMTGGAGARGGVTPPTGVETPEEQKASLALERKIAAMKAEVAVYQQHSALLATTAPTERALTLAYSDQARAMERKFEIDKAAAGLDDTTPKKFVDQIKAETGALYDAKKAQEDLLAEGKLMESIATPWEKLNLAIKTVGLTIKETTGYAAMMRQEVVRFQVGTQSLAETAGLRTATQGLARATLATTYAGTPSTGTLAGTQAQTELKYDQEIADAREKITATQLMFNAAQMQAAGWTPKQIADEKERNTLIVGNLNATVSNLEAEKQITLQTDLQVESAKVLASIATPEQQLAGKYADLAAMVSAGKISAQAADLAAGKFAEQLTGVTSTMDKLKAASVDAFKAIRDSVGGATDALEKYLMSPEKHRDAMKTLMTDLRSVGTGLFDTLQKSISQTFVTGPLDTMLKGGLQRWQSGGGFMDSFFGNHQPAVPDWQRLQSGAGGVGGALGAPGTVTALGTAGNWMFVKVMNFPTGTGTTNAPGLNADGTGMSPAQWMSFVTGGAVDSNGNATGMGQGSTVDPNAMWAYLSGEPVSTTPINTRSGSIAGTGTFNSAANVYGPSAGAAMTPGTGTFGPAFGSATGNAIAGIGATEAAGAGNSTGGMIGSTILGSMGPLLGAGLTSLIGSTGPQGWGGIGGSGMMGMLPGLIGSWSQGTGMMGMLGGAASGAGSLLSSAGTGIMELLSMLFANGGVIAGGQVQQYGLGQIFTKPTMFPMANGMGLIGEAGPEAAMPLTRTASGRLGVHTSGGGGSDSGGVVSVVMHNHTGSDMQHNAKVRRRPDGSKQMVIELKQMFIDDVNSGGKVAQAFEGKYGLKQNAALR
jgi:hypothetical protein